MGQVWNSETYKQPENKPPLGNELLQSTGQLQIRNDRTVLPLNTQTKIYLPHGKAGIIWSKVVPKIPALASIMHQLLTPLIKSAYSFYNRATDSDKAAAARTLELNFFSYILKSACSQIIFQDRRERVR